MHGRKWTVTIGVVVLMVLGAGLSSLWARRSVHDEQRRVRDAVARAYPSGTHVRVVSCRVLPVPSSDANSGSPRGRYSCVVVGRCRQTRSFEVPVESNGTPADAIAAPLGPPSPARCG